MSSPTKIKTLLEEACRDRLFSGYQLVYGCATKAPESIVGGQTSYWPGAVPVSESSWFDIGSVTKAVFTTTILADAVDKTKASLTDTLERIDNDFVATPYAKLQLGELLSHSAGLRWWHPIFRDLGTRSAKQWLLDNASSMVVELPRKGSVYSDIGFLLLGCVLEKWFGSTRIAFQKGVVEKLGLSDVMFGPMPSGSEVAATEYSLVRNELMWGRVFDENADALGGAAAHAGLFGRSRGLAKFCQAWLDVTLSEGHWISTKTAKLFTTKAGLVPGSTWGYGWDTPSRPTSSSGAHFSGLSFGMLGYPGASLWIDPSVAGYVVLLTNRIHPSRYDDRIKSFRPKVHDLIAEYWRN